MRYANHIELQRDMARMAREARELAAKARKLEAENKRLRKALEPMTRGTFWLTGADVQRAYKALGQECPLSVKLAEHRAATARGKRAAGESPNRPEANRHTHGQRHA